MAQGRSRRTAGGLRGLVSESRTRHSFSSPFKGIQGIATSAHSAGKETLVSHGCKEKSFLPGDDGKRCFFILTLQSCLRCESKVAPGSDCCDFWSLAYVYSEGLVLVTCELRAFKPIPKA